MNTAKFEETEPAAALVAGNGADGSQSSVAAPARPTVFASAAEVVIHCAVCRGDFILAAEPIRVPVDPARQEAELEADLHAAVKRAAALFREAQGVGDGRGD